jgi:hypothetical protein
MTAYFDTNIFAYIENGSLSLVQIEESIGVIFSKIFYSEAHIQEALEIQGNSLDEKEIRIRKRLDLIEQITKSKYLYEDMQNNVHELIESPFEVLRTITEVDFAQDIMKNLSNFTTEYQKENLRAILDIDPARINNYAPSEVIEYLNKKIYQNGHEFTFLSLMEHGVSFHPHSDRFGLSNKIAGLFELLDIFGFWKDKYTVKSNYARLNDSSHAFFAGCCDFFITDDKRTRNKSKVVYDLYNIQTKVLSSKGVE